MSPVIRSTGSRTDLGRGLRDSDRGKRRAGVEGVSQVLGSLGIQASRTSIVASTCHLLGRSHSRRAVNGPNRAAPVRSFVTQRAVSADDLLVVGITPATLRPAVVISDARDDFRQLPERVLRTPEADASAAA